jgi:putative alpha-1,2-mannosidase
MKLLLAKSNAGRNLLHLLCLLRPRKSTCSIFLLVALIALLNAAQSQAQVDFVDTRIGNVGILLEPTRPTVSLPNSMVRVYPVRKDGLDDQIQSFPLTIISHRLGELFWLMPNEGTPADSAWNQRAAYDQETSTPYFYSVRFDNSLIKTEFTPTARCGYFRFTFPSGKPVLLLANRAGGNLSAVGTNPISGTGKFQ